MKKITTALLLFAALVSCQDVIEVEVPTEDPRLIVDALIRVDTTEQFTQVAVKVSQTSSFFESIPAANLQQITITNQQSGQEIALIEDPLGSGIYAAANPLPTEFLISGELILEIGYEDQLYEAYAQFIPTVPIDGLEQGDGTLFGDDETEVIVTFTDQGDRDDYYLFDFGFGSYLTTEDTFYQGQQFSFSYFYDDRVGAGDQVTVRIMGIDRDFYNYMEQLLEQSGDNAGPFQTPAVTVRGNIINVTGIDNTTSNVGSPDNFALGYFAIVQEYEQSLTLE
jgi:hypothetical protein